MKKSKQLPLNVSISKAKPGKLFYFVVTGTIYDPKTGKCLILQRSKREIAHPGLWGVTGGKLEHQDLLNNPPDRMNFDIPNWDGLVEKLLEREALEESGLRVSDPRIFASLVFLRPDNVPVVCFKYGLKYLSGEVKVPEEFDDYAWVDAEEVKKYETIDGIDQEIAQVIEIYQNS